MNSSKSSDKKQHIIDRIRSFGIETGIDEAEAFSEYFDLLVGWNSRMNLTAVTEFDAVVDRHFIDSLALIQKGLLPKGASVIDVGSGAGFPGIPLAITRPDIAVTLLDATNKRSEFQRVVKEKLGLNNLEIINGRAEDVSRETKYRETFDIAVARAVADLAVLAEFCLPFVKIGGKFIAYKGADVADEITNAANAVETLGGGLAEVVPYGLSGGTAHSLVVISKTAPTPEKHPRRAGIPSKRPL